MSTSNSGRTISHGALPSYSSRDDTESPTDHDTSASCSSLPDDDSLDCAELTSISPSLRKKAWSLCKTYLNGEWAVVGPEDISIKQISGGLSNWIYLCSLPQGLNKNVREENADEPRSVLLRLFGQKIPSEAAACEAAFNELVNAQITDNVIFTLLSERRLGPRLFGIFAGGRLEEFIESKSLVDFSVCQTAHCVPIAKIIANIHLLKVPIKKDGLHFIIDTMSNWAKALAKVEPSSLGEEERGFAQEVLSLDFHAEIQWLSRVLPLINSPVVFCHNDLNGGNLLQRTQLWNKTDNDCGGAGGLVAIDFEFCAYNYRAYDIANHWNEWIYDYGNKEYPYYFVDSSKAPSMEQKTIFLRGYLQEVRESAELSPKGLNEAAGIESLLREIELFSAVPDIVWALWCIHRAVYSDIQFGYWHYAANRMRAYLSKKEAMVRILQVPSN